MFGNIVNNNLSGAVKIFGLKNQQEVIHYKSILYV